MPVRKIKYCWPLAIILLLAACSPKPADDAAQAAEALKDSARYLIIHTARALDVVECGGGSARWAVRVAADPQAWRIDLKQVKDVTLGELERLEYQAQQDYPIVPPLRSGPELGVYRTTGYLVRIEAMDDGDLHMIIADTPVPAERLMRGMAVHTLTAEVPDPLCVQGRHDQVKGPSRFADQFRTVRHTLAAALPDVDEGAFLPGIPIEIIGIGGMDQEKASRLIELELHPVLAVRIGRTGA
ncbi:hypothetical protein [Dongia deserti]|uniref:hypothetical protein n=1 Tax=Dongia deserti TaxID=2268030 RepID=UPI002547C298|nr:hypothetical protein [Dongia deserti]